MHFCQTERVTVFEVLGLAVTAVLTVNLTLNLRSGTLWRDYKALRVLKRGRWFWALLGGWAVLLVVVAVGLVLYNIWPKVMGFSWLVLVATPEEAPHAGGNILVKGLQIPGFAWIFLALFAANVPRLAMNEELAFRKGYKKPGPIALQSVKFGLIHTLVGVPIAFGLALSIAGGWFAYQYLKGGVRRSAAYHSIHNWTLLTWAAIWLARLLPT